MRVLPFNIKQLSWHNYTNLLKKMDFEISSLSDYLKIFNPDFYIINETINVVSSNNWEDSTTKVLDDLSKYGQQITVTNGNEEKQYKICLPGELGFRQGIFIKDKNVFCSFEKLRHELSEEDWNQYLANGVVFPINQSQVIWSKTNPKGLSGWDNKQRKNKNNYLIIAQSYAALYQINSIQNGIEFLYIKNGQNIIGENLSCSIELLPNRYFICNTNQSYWTGTQWSITGAVWENEESAAKPLVMLKRGAFWTGSYVLMHNLYLETNKTSTNEGYKAEYEEFIMDEEYSASNLNIANHSTVMYTITGNIQRSNLTSKLWNNIFVSII